MHERRVPFVQLDAGWRAGRAVNEAREVDKVRAEGLREEGELILNVLEAHHERDHF